MDAAKRRSLTISLYASLLNLGVSLIVPMNTKNRPSAKERATMVTVLGETIFGKVSVRLASVVPLQLSSLSGWRCWRGEGLDEYSQIWLHVLPLQYYGAPLESAVVKLMVSNSSASSKQCFSTLGLGKIITRPLDVQKQHVFVGL